MSGTPSATPERSTELEPGMQRPLTAIDLLAFVCELFAFVSLAIWGFASWPVPWNIVAGIGAPALAILVWALFVSPRAVLRVHPFMRAVIELLVYLSATIAWWSMDQAWIGLGFGVVAVTVGAIAGRRRFT